MGQCVSQKQSSQSQRRSEHSSSRCVVKVASANKTKVVSRWCCTILLFHRSKSRSHRRDEDIPTRRATSGKTLELTIPVEGNDSFKVKYAFISQPGYYPDQISKPNQDKYCVRENFRNHSGEAFFGVYDGHGEHGADCADFVAQTLPDNVKSSAYLQPSGNLDMSNYARAFLRTNEQLEVEPTIDDVMSGTTAVTLHIIGEKLVVSNVGDSRACMGVYTEDGLVRLLSLPPQGYASLSKVKKSCERYRIHCAGHEGPDTGSHAFPSGRTRARGEARSDYHVPGTD